MHNKLSLIKISGKMLVAISSSLMLCCPVFALNAQQVDKQSNMRIMQSQSNAHAVSSQLNQQTVSNQSNVQTVGNKQETTAVKPQQSGEKKTWTLKDARRVNVFRQKAVKQYVKDSMDVLVARCQKVLNSAYMAQELEKTVTDVPGYEGYPVKLYTYYMRSDVKTHADKKGRVMLLMPDAQKLARWTISACWRAVQNLDYKYTQKLLNYIMLQNGGQFAVRGVVYEDMYTRGYYEPYVFKDGVTVYVADHKMVATDSTLKWCTDAMLEYYLKLDNSQLKPYSGRFARISSTTREMYYEYNGVTNYKDAFKSKDSNVAAIPGDSQVAGSSKDSQSVASPEDSQGVASSGDSQVVGSSKDSQGVTSPGDSQVAGSSKDSQSVTSSGDSQGVASSGDSQSVCCIKNSYGKVINVGTGDSHETRSLKWLDVVRSLYLKAWKSDDNELMDAWAWWVFVNYVNHVGEEL